MRWPLQPLQPSQKTQLQPPFGPSLDSLCHPCITATHLSYRFLSLNLPLPPCAILLVYNDDLIRIIKIDRAILLATLLQGCFYHFTYAPSTASKLPNRKWPCGLIYNIWICRSGSNMRYREWAIVDKGQPQTNSSWLTHDSCDMTKHFWRSRNLGTRWFPRVC